MSRNDARIRVALVEDDAAVREGLEMWIQESTTCRCVGSYASAEQALPRLVDGQADVVLMDIQLPGMSGIDCIREVRRRAPATQCLMLTVFEDDDRVFRSLQAGASGYLLKHTPPAKLLDAILELHRGGSPMSAPIARRVVEVFRGPAHPAADVLSRRESEVLSGLAQGQLYKEIADQLGLSVDTVRTHIHNIYRKLHVRSRTEAVMCVYGRVGVKSK